MITQKWHHPTSYVNKATPTHKTVQLPVNTWEWMSSSNNSFSPLHNSFPVVTLCHPGYCISFCCPSIGECLVNNVLLLVPGLRMLHFCMLVVVHFLKSNVCGLIYCVQYVSSQFNLVLPTAVYALSYSLSHSKLLALLIVR